MDPNAITPENLVVVASFIVPGYFAIRSYGAVHTKVDRDFSKLLIESIAFSLPIVGLYNATLRHIFRVHIVYPTSVKYFLPLLLCSLLLGYLVGQFRKLRWVEALA